MTEEFLTLLSYSCTIEREGAHTTHINAYILNIIHIFRICIVFLKLEVKNWFLFLLKCVFSIKAMKLSTALNEFLYLGDYDVYFHWAMRSQCHRLRTVIDYVL